MTNLSSFPVPTRESTFTMPAVPEIRKETVLDYLKAFGLGTQLSEPEKLQFIEIAQAFKLNPFKREVHVAVFGEGENRRMSIITGYEVYLKRAERTGKLDGWRAWVEGEGDTMKALVEIHRRDWSQPFIHEVYWREAVQKKRDGTPTSFWLKQPRFQLKKVAISQGFRLAFPDELGGMPYDAAELPDSESISPIPPVPDIPALSTLTGGMSDVNIVATIPTDAVPSAPKQVQSPLHHDRFPEESINALLDRLEGYLDSNFESFTEKHYEWVLEKARKSRDREGVLKMIGYAEKVVKNNNAIAGASA